MVVDSDFPKTSMKDLVRKSGKDTEGNSKASDKWKDNFINRFGITNQKKTNKKSKSVQERLSQVRNFHWWALCQMATEKP